MGSFRFYDYGYKLCILIVWVCVEAQLSVYAHSAQSPSDHPPSNTHNPINPPAQERPVDKRIPAIPKLVPHRATYTVKLDKLIQDSDVKDVQGVITLQLVNTGDGWAFEQKISLMIYHLDGEAEQLISSSASYESFDGQRYSFDSRSQSPGAEEEHIQGDAQINSDGSGTAIYQFPFPQRVPLPQGTIFPINHLLQVLTTAMKGDRVISATVFDGASETHEPVDVNTVVGGSQDPKLSLGDQSLYRPKKMWPVRMGVYPTGSEGPEPEVEIVQSLLDHGVIKEMILDQGSFTMKASLKQVDVFDTAPALTAE